MSADVEWVEHWSIERKQGVELLAERVVVQPRVTNIETCCVPCTLNLGKGVPD